MPQMRIKFLRIAQRLVLLYFEKQRYENTATKNWAVANTALRSSYRMVFDAGLARSVDEIEGALLEICQQADVRPPERMVNNQAQQEYDRHIAEELCRKMEWFIGTAQVEVECGLSVSAK